MMPPVQVVWVHKVLSRLEFVWSPHTLLHAGWTLKLGFKFNIRGDNSGNDQIAELAQTFSQTKAVR